VDEDAAGPPSGAVVAVDPGTGKCGVALVGPGGEALQRAVVEATRIPAVLEGWGARGVPLVVGRGTGHQAVVALLRDAGCASLTVVDETGSTMEARRLYWCANPPRGWRRLVPRGMLVPPAPVDDWAAVALARRHLGI
jgi:hypothetical protein